MIKLALLKKKSKFPEADYILDKPEMFFSLLEVLTPKFKGNWEIVLVDPKLKEVKSLIDNGIPEYINCTIMLVQAKLDNVVMDHPTLAPKTLSPKDEYKEMISSLKHVMEDRAMWMLYNAMGPNMQLLQEALDKLDAECEELYITVKQVQQTFAVSKRVYASDVLRAFLIHDRYRWFKLNTLTKELGEEYAYYAIYKQVRELLADKNKYLHNEDVKNRLVGTVDAPLICYAYVLFANSNSWRNLHGVLHDLEERNQYALERSQYVNLQ